MAAKECGEVFISYSSVDITLVKNIQDCLKKNEIDCVVADDVKAGTHTLDVIVHSLSRSKACVFLVTPAALESSWFAFETILTLERSHQRGQLNSVILLHNVTEDELPKFALFDMIDKYELDLDEFGHWNNQQIKQVIKTIQDLAEKIRSCPWYSKNMPIAVYELVPKDSNIPTFIEGPNIKNMGSLGEIKAEVAGNKRIFRLNVYCIEDGEEKYYCVAQYPSVLGAIYKMTKSPMIDLDEPHTILQVARFYYTLQSILQHSNVEGCRNQAKLLWLDGSEAATSVLLKAVKRDVKRTGFQTLVTDLQKVLHTLEDGLPNKEYEATILYNSDDAKSNEICDQIEKHLLKKNVRLFPSPNKPGTRPFTAMEEAAEKARWLILIVTQDSLIDNDVFKMQTMALIANSVHSKKVRVIPVTDKISADDILPDFLKWVTYIDIQTTGFENRVLKALRGEDIELALDGGLIPAGNVGYGLAWGYVTNYLKVVLPKLEHLRNLLKQKAGNMCMCPSKLFLLVPKTCYCPGRIKNEHVTHVYSSEEISDCQGGADIIKGLDMYSISKEGNFFGQYPAPLRCLHAMNDCMIAGINPESMARECERFCDTLLDLLHGPIGGGLQSKCELVFFDDEVSNDLQMQLLPRLSNQVDPKETKLKRKSGHDDRKDELKQAKMMN
ncbi:uncharacterized protein LOC132549838 [Ylistrum balloti]|uniref:uncharacterized protein LOC132549838 n=1 Tax=Ylistrum balloti TaxID=509963 RepID=UPI0029059394|nr:uncharacterized protein LOC132549838 [Ylistrum balloti]